MTGIASLPMYDWPEVSGANDALWQFLAARLRKSGIPAPDHLDRAGRYFEPWRSPDLVLSQACGYPYATELRGKVRLVGTPCYAVPGCDGPNYCSMVIASRASGIGSLAGMAGATAAVNSEHSQSGHWALRAAIAATPDAVAPARAVLSGGHRESLRMLAAGAADVAAIDAVCWAMAERYEPGTVAKVQVIARSPSAPGLPLIAALGSTDATVEALREACAAAIAEPALAGTRETLFLAGFEVLPDHAYDRVLELKREALARPFPPLEAA